MLFIINALFIYLFINDSQRMIEKFVIKQRYIKNILRAL